MSLTLEESQVGEDRSSRDQYLGRLCGCCQGDRESGSDDDARTWCLNGIVCVEIVVSKEEIEKLPPG